MRQASSPSTLPPRILEPLKGLPAQFPLPVFPPSRRVLEEPLQMEVSHPLSRSTHRKTHRVRGPRPYSWISSGSDSSNECRDIWPWAIRSPNVSRESTLRWTSSTESSDSDSFVSSPSSHPVHAPDAGIACGGKPHHRHGRRRKPAGPRAPRDGACFDVRPLGLWINTSPSVIPQFQRDVSPIIPSLTPIAPDQRIEMFPSRQMTPFAITPTNFALDWDAIFELLGCSEAPTTDGGGW